MKNLRLVYKLSLGFGLVLVLLGVIVLVGYWGLGAVVKSVDVSEDASALGEYLLECLKYEKDFALYGFSVREGDTKNAETAFREVKSQFESQVEMMLAELEQEQDVARLTAAQRDFRAYVAAFDESVTAYQEKDAAFEDWSRLGWNITSSIDRAVTEVIEPALASAERTQDFAALMKWSAIGDGLHTDVIEPFLLLRVTAVYLIATDADVQWKAYQEQLYTAQASTAQWAALIADNTQLATVASEIEGYLAEYEQAGERYYAAVLTERAASVEMVDNARRVLGEVDEVRVSQQQARRAAQSSAVNISLFAAVIALVMGIFAAIYITRSIVGPALVLQQVSERVAEGDVAVSIDIAQRDEMGKLADVFRKLIDYVRAMAYAAERLSQGDVVVDVAPRSDRDVLGAAFERMVVYQQRMTGVAERLAQGDLTANITPQSERDGLGNAFAQMVRQLREMVGQVQQHATQLALATQQITAATEQSATAMTQVAATVQQIAIGTGDQTRSVTDTIMIVEQVSRSIEGVARGAQEQAHAVTRSAELTGQLASTVGEVSANAQGGVQSVTQAAQMARAGAETVAATITGMESIRNKVQVLAQRVQEMGVRSGEIGDIVATIDEIASQTNLLALNAAIEAARAGEYGRGFSVVADEVRKLAENSIRATKEITVLIREIQQVVAAAVAAADEGVTEVEAGVVRSGKSQQALADILAASESGNRQMSEIAQAARQMEASAQELVTSMETVSAVVEENTAATEEMAAGADEVSHAVENIASISEENSAATEEVSASVEEVSAQAEEVTASAESLSAMAEELQALVAQFRLAA